MKQQKSIVQLQLTKLRNSMLSPMSFVESSWPLLSTSSMPLFTSLTLRCHRHRHQHQQQPDMHIATHLVHDFLLICHYFMLCSMFTCNLQVVVAANLAHRTSFAAHMRARKNKKKIKSNQIEFYCVRYHHRHTIDTN